VREGIASVLDGGAASYLHRHLGQTRVPGVATADVGRRSCSSVSGGTTATTRPVELPQAVPGVRRHTALLVSTLMDGNELRGGVPILGTVGSDLNRTCRCGEASPRSSMDDA
jgi:hypothetical protein